MDRERRTQGRRLGMPSRGRAWLLAIAVSGAMATTGGVALAGGAKTPDRITLEELDSLRSQIMACWNPPDVSGPYIRVRIALKPSGALDGKPEILNQDGTEIFEKFAGAALKALDLCQPFEMPPEKYELWQEIIVNFDPHAPPADETAPAAEDAPPGGQGSGEAPPGLEAPEYLGS